MASLNTAWEISISALTADQAALATVANNTANVSTPGYTVETVQWAEKAPLNISGRSIGSGVEDLGAVSQRDRILNQALDQQTQTQAASQARLNALGALQATFTSAITTTNGSGSNGTGDIGAGLSGFFGSLQQLEAAPSDTSLREAVLAAAHTVASDFNTAGASLAQQQVSLDGEVSANVTQINSLARSIASLNKQIQSSSPNADAGTLEDQRQYDLQSLSKLVGIDQVTTERNGLTVTTASGAVLVVGDQAVALTTAPAGGVTHIYDGTTDITAPLASGGGQIGGQLQVRDGDIPSTQTALDTLAFDFGTAVNTANQAGSDAQGNPGGAIFSLPSSSPGSALAISVLATNPASIAAAASGAGVGDSSNAATMAGLAQQTIVAGQTPADAYAGLVASVGSVAAQVSAANTAQQAALTQLTNQQSALSSVSLDTEATSLQNLEQAYQAASKVFAILNTLIGDAINLGTATTV